MPDPRSPLASIARCCLLLLAAGLFGCGGASKEGGSPDAATDGAAPLERVVLQLNWFPEMEHGGFYAALVHGYYRQEGLDVVIRSGGARTPVVQEVASGRADFAIGNADEILLGRSNEADLVAVFSPLQDNPRCILAHKSAGVNSLAELKGLNLAIKFGQPFEIFLESKGYLEGVEKTPFTGGVAHFLASPKHAQQGYVFSEPFIARQQGADPVSLMVSEAGFNPYAGLLFTSGDRIRRQPDLVRRMVRASLRGWRKYLAEPAAANDAIHQANSDMSPQALEFGAEAMVPLCLPDGMRREELGRMSDERWRVLAEQLASMGLLDNNKVSWKAAFTNSFLDEAPEKAPSPHAETP